jgi:SOS response regulatory protein OraA/RecX
MQLYRQREYIPTYSNEQIISNTPVLDNILNSSDNRKNYGATLGEIFENAPDEYKRLFADKLLLISKQPEALTELFLFSGGWSRNLFSKDRTCRDLLVYAVYEPRFIDSVLTNLYQNKLLSEKIFASEEIFFDFAVAAHGQSGGEFLKFFGLYRNTGIRQNDISDKLAKNFLRYRQFSAAQTETIIAILNNLNENELAMAIPLLFSGRINGYRQIAPVCRYLTRSNDKKNWLSLTDAITRHHILKAAEFT